MNRCTVISRLCLATLVSAGCACSSNEQPGPGASPVPDSGDAADTDGPEDGLLDASEDPAEESTLVGPQWLRTFQGSWVSAVEVGPGNDLYIGGMQVGPCRFGNIEYDTGDVVHAFIARLDSNGEAKWVAHGGPQDKVHTVLGRMAVAPSGQVFLVGSFEGAAQFGDITLTSNGATDVFVARTSADGGWDWAVSAGGADSDYGHRIAYRDGVVVIGGDFAGTATFGSLSRSGTPVSNVFVAALDAANGSFLDVLVAEGDQTYTSNSSGLYECNTVTSMVVDEDGVWVGGPFAGTAKFGDIEVPADTNSRLRAYLARVDLTSGTLSWNWARALPWISSLEAGLNRAPLSLTRDPEGNIIVCSNGCGEGGCGSAAKLPVLLKMDVRGEPIWFRAPAHFTQTSQCFGVASDAAGNLYTAGEFQGTLSFVQPSAEEAMVAEGDHDAFFALWTPDGQAVWETSAGGPGLDYGWDIAIAPDGGLFFGGNFKNPGTFADQVVPALGVEGDGFLWKYTSGSTP